MYIYAYYNQVFPLYMYCLKLHFIPLGKASLGEVRWEHQSTELYMWGMESTGRETPSTRWIEEGNWNLKFQGMWNVFYSEHIEHKKLYKV